MVTPDRRYDPELVPPEWSQWLKMTRGEPPTEEEVAGYLHPFPLPVWASTAEPNGAGICGGPAMYSCNPSPKFDNQCQWLHVGQNGSRSHSHRLSHTHFLWMPYT